MDANRSSHCFGWDINKRISFIDLNIAYFLPFLEDAVDGLSVGVEPAPVLEQTASPKMVLVGGSNLAFSIDSGLLAEEFGLPVVNMGLAKSVGLGYLLQETILLLHILLLIYLSPTCQ